MAWRSRSRTLNMAGLTGAGAGGCKERHGLQQGLFAGVLDGGPVAVAQENAEPGGIQNAGSEKVWIKLRGDLRYIPIPKKAEGLPAKPCAGQMLNREVSDFRAAPQRQGFATPRDVKNLKLGIAL